jgi:hypothetical protein
LAELGTLGQVICASLVETLADREVQQMNSDDKKVSVPWAPKRKIADNHGVCVKTIDRWVAAGKIDPPKKINGRDYFPATATPKADEGAAA